MSGFQQTALADVVGPTQIDFNNNNENMKVSVRSILGIVGLLFTMLFYFNFSIMDVARSILLFASGNANIERVSIEEVGLLSMVFEVTAVILLTYVVVFTIQPFVTLIRGKSKSYKLQEILESLDKGPLLFFGIVLGEEVFARYLFMGVFASFVLHFVDSNFVVFVFFLIGNVLWGYIHIYNFKDKAERSVFLVLPQLIAGFSFGYLYLKYGLFVAILGHFYYNVILLSSMKEIDVDVPHYVSLVYYGCIAVAAYWIMAAMNLSLSDLAPWFNGSHTLSAIAGYTFLHYAVVFIFIDAVVEVGAYLLGLDKHFDLDTHNLIRENNFLVMPFAALLMTVFLLGLNWFLQFSIDNALLRFVAVLILLVLLKKVVNALATGLAAAVVRLFVNVEALTLSNDFEYNEKNLRGMKRLWLLSWLVSVTSTYLIVNAILSFSIENDVARVFVLALVFVLLTSSKSGSSMARQVLVGLPVVFTVVAGYTVNGFLFTYGMLLLFWIYNMIPRKVFLKHYNEKHRHAELINSILTNM